MHTHQQHYEAGPAAEARPRGRTEQHAGPAVGRSFVTASLNELLGLAGLPVAIRDGGSKPVGSAQDWDRRVGVLVHQVIADLVVASRAQPSVNVGDLATEIAATAVRDRRLGNLASARGRVAGMASTYVQRLAPPQRTMFLGSEVRARTTGINGRVDLAWAHPVHGVFYDEVKSWRQVLAVLDADTTEQLDRYLTAGLADHGDRFAGVRLLTLSAIPRSLFIDRLGTVYPLAGSLLDPVSLAADATSSSVVA